MLQTSNIIILCSQKVNKNMHYSSMEANSRHKESQVECSNPLSKSVAIIDAECGYTHLLVYCLNFIAQLFNTKPYLSILGKGSILTHYFTCLHLSDTARVSNWNLDAVTWLLSSWIWLSQPELEKKKNQQECHNCSYCQE